MGALDLWRVIQHSIPYERFGPSTTQLINHMNFVTGSPLSDEVTLIDWLPPYL